MDKDEQYVKPFEEEGLCMVFNCWCNHEVPCVACPELMEYDAYCREHPVECTEWED